MGAGAAVWANGENPGRLKVPGPHCIARLPVGLRESDLVAWVWTAPADRVAGEEVIEVLSTPEACWWWWGWRAPRLEEPDPEPVAEDL
jgi:hypothetical protein